MSSKNQKPPEGGFWRGQGNTRRTILSDKSSASSNQYNDIELVIPNYTYSIAINHTPLSRPVRDGRDGIRTRIV